MKITVDNIVALVSKAMKYGMHVHVSRCDQRIYIYKNEKESISFCIVGGKENTIIISSLPLYTYEYIYVSNEDIDKFKALCKEAREYEIEKLHLYFKNFIFSKDVN